MTTSVSMTSDEFSSILKILVSSAKYGLVELR